MDEFTNRSDGARSPCARFIALHRPVGNTPLLAGGIRYRGDPRRIYAKHESLSFMGSGKDRRGRRRGMTGARWDAADTVAGFAQSPPNAVLLRVAEDRLPHSANQWAIDLGCGAGRNAIPLARLGWRVLGLDLSMAMLTAFADRARSDQAGARVRLARAAMDAIPAAGGSVDLVVAHGIWNLARTGSEFRRALAEAARVARPGATLFVFTFSRHTLPPEIEPVAGETFVFTQFSGEPQCFLAEDQLVDELTSVGFARDASTPLRELNRPAPGSLRVMSGPVIYEGAFRMTGRP